MIVDLTAQLLVAGDRWFVDAGRARRGRSSLRWRFTRIGRTNSVFRAPRRLHTGRSPADDDFYVNSGGRDCNDDAGGVNATFVSLLASCQLHGIEPWSYLRDLLVLLPEWPVQRVLELAPVNWNQTLE